MIISAQCFRSHGSAALFAEKLRFSVKSSAGEAAVPPVSLS